MKDEFQGAAAGEKAAAPAAGDYLLPASILVSAVIVAGAWVYAAGLKAKNVPAAAVNPSAAGGARESGEEIPPYGGVTLPVRWGDLGLEMARAGVVDPEKFESVYAGRGGLSEETSKLLYGGGNGNIKITRKNSGEILNLLWAFGLGNKNDILEKGPMTDPRYGGTANFASTAGWTLARGGPEGDASRPYGAGAMSHYSRHPFAVLNEKQQELAERAAKNIYRPCCGNSAYFPDCNHGMAMLGLVELMASQGIGYEEMLRYAAEANSHWFPDEPRNAACGV